MPLIDYCNKHGIAVTAYSPLGSGRLLEDSKIKEIAEKHNKSPAQVLILFQIQRGVITIPRSTQKERIQENFNIFDFTLTKEEMEEIEALNSDTRYNTESFAKNHKYWPFKIPY
jgi:methylglyoxal/glyoxal reductase